MAAECASKPVLIYLPYSTLEAPSIPPPIITDNVLLLYPIDCVFFWVINIWGWLVGAS